MTVGTDAYQSPRLDAANLLYEEQDDWVALCLTFAELILGHLADGELAALQRVADTPQPPRDIKLKVQQRLVKLKLCGKV